MSEEIERCGCDESVSLRKKIATLEVAVASATSSAEIALSRLSEALGDRDRLAEAVAVPPETLKKSPNPMQAILHGARGVRARLNEAEAENVALRNEVRALRDQVEKVRSIVGSR